MMQVQISGVVVTLTPQSLRIVDSIGQRSTAQFTVQDYTGVAQYVQGQPVTVRDGGNLNLLSPNQSNAEAGTTGFNTTAAGTTRTQTAAQAWEETHSIQVVCDGTVSNQGVIVSVPATSYLPNTPYTHSIWITGTPGTTLLVTVKRTDSFLFMAPAVPVTLTGPLGTWQRVQVMFQTPAAAGMPAGGAGFDLEVATPTNEAVTFYVDGLQFEQDSSASDWHTGGTYGGPLVYAGVIASAKRAVASSYSSMLLHAITCTDWHYLADKRIAATSYAYRTCGYMVRDLVDNFLAVEGVTYGRGVNLLSAQQSDVEAPLGGGDFAVVGGGVVTLTQDTTPANVRHGAGALKCITGGSVAHQGFSAAVAVAGGNFPYGGSIVLSVYLKASAGTPTVQLFVSSNAGLVGTAVNCVLSTSFQRFSCVVEIPYPFTATDVRLAVDTGAGAQALTIWADQLQMELAMATAWAPGGGVSSNLLSAEQADVEGVTTTGFATSGGGVVTIAQDTTVPAWSNAGSLKVVVNGAAAFQGVQMSVVGALPANGVLTVSFYAMSATAMQLYIPVNGVGQSNFLPLLTPQWTRYQLTIQLPAAPPNPLIWQILTPAAQAGTFWLDGLQMEVGAAPTSWEAGGTAMTIQDGPEVVSQIVNYKQVSTALDDLATLAGFYWAIDANKRLTFANPAGNVAPWTLDGTQAVDGTLFLEDTNPLYRNSQWMLGSTGTTLPQTETQKGDGSKRAFLTSFPIHNVPSDIHVNAGAAQTIGILGVDTGKQWYWNKGKNVLTQDTSGTLLATTDVLSVTYIGEYAVVSNSVDSAQQTAEQLIEGAGSGIVENVVSDASLVTLAQAFQSGSALLSKFAQAGTIVTFTTRTAGLVPGQLLSVNLPAPWQFSGVQALVQTIIVTYDDFQFWYDVQALVGPVNATWVQFFQNAASKQYAIDSNVGAATETIALASTQTAAWTWTASYAATVTACPVFPMTFPFTLC